ncbi:hypothetical protein TNCV_3296941 [Trichonephila clavipes]|uniref:Uncharacterized protein n=1 Tax=Trichonephila clavipes TaxID=2585209 RepID=A0A8X6T2Y4_TRICX|nr:hypothetical protein TNCV_3296941 [Trichonephila clavipes]
MAKTVLDSPLIVSPPRCLNSCRVVISDPDLLCAFETEIMEGLSDQGVNQSLHHLHLKHIYFPTHLSLSSVIPTIQSESQLPIPISTTTSSSLNTLLLHLHQSKHVYFLQLLINLPHYQLKFNHQFVYQRLSLLHPIVNLLIHLKSQRVKEKRKKQELEIEIKLTPHKPKKTLFHYPELGMIIDDVDEKLMDAHMRYGFSHFMSPTIHRRN